MILCRKWKKRNSYNRKVKVLNQSRAKRVKVNIYLAAFTLSRDRKEKRQTRWSGWLLFHWCGLSTKHCLSLRHRLVQWTPLRGLKAELPWRSNILTKPNFTLTPAHLNLLNNASRRSAYKALVALYSDRKRNRRLISGSPLSWECINDMAPAPSLQEGVEDVKGGAAA